MEHYTNTCQGYFIFPFISIGYVLPNRRTKILTFEKERPKLLKNYYTNIYGHFKQRFTHLYEFIRLDELLQKEKPYLYIAILTLLTNFVLIRYIIASYLYRFVQANISLHTVPYPPILACRVFLSEVVGVLEHNGVFACLCTKR